MSKRKSPATIPDARSGKPRLADEEEQEFCASGSDAGHFLEELVDDLGDDFGEDDEDGEDGEDDDDLNDEDEMLAAFGDGDEASTSQAPEDEGEDDENVELPLDASQLETAAELNFSAISVSAAQARLIAPMLLGNNALTKIQFDGRDLSVTELKEGDELEWDSEEYTDVEAIIIAEFLKTNTVITRLDLARNQISDDGAKALSLALINNTSLEYLNLESNHVGQKGGNAFSRAVNENSSLQYLNLMYNAIPSTSQQEIRDVWTRVRQGQHGLHL